MFFSFHPVIDVHESRLVQRSAFTINAHNDVLKVRQNKYVVVHRNNYIKPAWFVVQDGKTVSERRDDLRDAAYAGTSVYDFTERAPPFFAPQL